MRIALLRHGQPEFSSTQRIHAHDMRKWIERYSISGLDSNSKPPALLVNQARDYDILVSSTLPRSIQSAQALQPHQTIRSEDKFVEAELPWGDIPILKLKPKHWAVLFRILWLLGYQRHAESLSESRKRAALAAETLIALAETHHHVLLVGHGIFNRLISKELQKRGWKTEDKPTSKHWSLAVFSR